MGGELVKNLFGVAFQELQRSPFSTFLSSVLQKTLTFEISAKVDQALSKAEGHMVSWSLHADNLCMSPMIGQKSSSWIVQAHEPPILSLTAYSRCAQNELVVQKID